MVNCSFLWKFVFSIHFSNYLPIYQKFTAKKQQNRFFYYFEGVLNFQKLKLKRMLISGGEGGGSEILRILGGNVSFARTPE